MIAGGKAVFGCRDERARTALQEHRELACAVWQFGKPAAARIPRRQGVLDASEALVPQQVVGLVVDWNEVNGPPVNLPLRTGFGTEMIEQAMTYELGATSELDYLPGGVHCRMELPTEHVAD